MQITTYRAEHATRFAELNLEWLERYGLLEPADEAQLADPVKYFLAPGGEIFIALGDAGEVFGTCAVVPHGDQGECEVAKLAVDGAVRGQGIARRLVETSLAWARSKGFRRAILVSNHQLRPALALYASLGFASAPVPPEFAQEYATADVYMTLDLAVTPAGR
jgi:GNAT superfamily N-acetyltransferase